jgi:hypothetical protein
MNYTEVIKVESADDLIEIFEDFEEEGYDGVRFLSLDGEYDTDPDSIEQYFEEGQLVPGHYGIVWVDVEPEVVMDSTYLAASVRDLKAQLDYFQKLK